MTYSSKIIQSYHIFVIAIDSPKLGNIGWCLLDIQKNQYITGYNLHDLFLHLIYASKTSRIILGFKSPLFVSLHPNLIETTKAKKDEDRRLQSGGTGAQSLTINLSIMIYIFKRVYVLKAHISYFLNEHFFSTHVGQTMIFEDLFRGINKRKIHINDPQIMVLSCISLSRLKILPHSILEEKQ